MTGVVHAVLHLLRIMNSIHYFYLLNNKLYPYTINRGSTPAVYNIFAAQNRPPDGRF